MKNKIKILSIIAIAVIGALMIYNHFDKKPVIDKSINKFSSEYTLVEQNNIYKYITIDEAIDILSNKTGIVFFCTPESQWCQNYAVYLNEALKEAKVNEINYLNIKDYRELNTVKYEKLVELLSNYIYQDDIGNKKIFMPDLTFVKDGVIIAHDNETSLVQSDVKVEDYWDNNSIKEFKEKIKENVIKMNEYVKEEEPTIINE